MLENLPLRTLEHGGLTVEGYSRAAVQSYFRVPELKLLFDCGGSPWDFMGTATVCVTHGHLDHMAALPAYVARRRMMKMDPPVVYVPAEIVENVEKLLRAWQRLDRGRMLCDVVGVEPGDEIELSREHLLTVYQTKHTVPSVGYLVWERKRKLRPDLQDLSQDEIRKIATSGEEVSVEVKTPLFGYTGDTAPPGLDDEPALYDAKILVTECSFFRPEHRREKIHKFGHIHLDDVLERAEEFRNERLCLGHFSTRYHDDQIRRICGKKLPGHLAERVELWF
ncbi:MAG: MBL fold metallo-hydrolase [Planctomycetota bacterium]